MTIEELQKWIEQTAEAGGEPFKELERAMGVYGAREWDTKSLSEANVGEHVVSKTSYGQDVPAVIGTYLHPIEEHLPAHQIGEATRTRDDGSEEHFPIWRHDKRHVVMAENGEHIEVDEADYVVIVPLDSVETAE